MPLLIQAVFGYPASFREPRDSCTCHTCLFGLCQNLLTEQLALSGPLTSKGVTFPRYSILEINQQIYIFNRNLQTFSKWVCNTTHRKNLLLHLRKKTTYIYYCFTEHYISNMSPRKQNVLIT